LKCIPDLSGIDNFIGDSDLPAVGRFVGDPVQNNL